MFYSESSCQVLSWWFIKYANIVPITYFLVLNYGNVIEGKLEVGIFIKQ